MVENNRITTLEIQSMKERGEKIVMLTAYDALMAGLEDKSGIDVILVGDSAGMVVAGHETTIPVTIEQMLYHTSCVTRSVKRDMVIGDMPFMTFQVSPEQALENAGRFLKEGAAHAIKIEGGVEADLLKQSLKWAEEKAKYPSRVKKICELGIGMNVHAKVIGTTIIDEKAFGTAHIAMGSNYWFGGSIRTIIHLDQVFRNPEVYVDGKLLKIP